MVAGAGSGKTRVLTHRIAHLIRDRGVSPFAILAITFTNKAADEMKSRVAALVGPVAEKMWVSTFHSACVRILRRDADLLGYPRQFTIYDEADAVRLTGYVIRDLGLDTKRFPPRSVHAAISAAKNDGVDAETYTQKAGNLFERKIGQVFAEYQSRLHRAGSMDFDDLLTNALRLLREHPQTLRHYQERFQHILVDEYQDTNRVQNELVLLLAADHRNIAVVGDQDQSIYAFRGADMRNIVEFEDAFPDTTVVLLEQNYRSTQTILDAANAVIAHNVSRKPKELWTDQGAGDPIVRYHADDEVDEAQWITREMAHLHDAADLQVPDAADRGRDGGPLRWGDIAVFYRTNAQSRVLEEQLMRVGIPYRVLGGTRFYDRKEIKDAVAYVRAVVNPVDEVSIKRVLNEPKRGVGATSVGRLDAWATAHGLPFLDALRRADDAGVSGKAAAWHPGVPANARRRGRHRGQWTGTAAPGAARALRLPRGPRGGAHHRIRGQAREPGGAGGSRQRGRVGRRVPRVDQPGVRRRRPRRGRSIVGGAHDPACRQGPRVSRRVHHRAGGRGLPPPALAHRARPARGGAAARLRRDHPSPPAPLPHPRLEPDTVRWHAVQPAQPLPRRDPRRIDPRRRGPCR